MTVDDWFEPEARAPTIRDVALRAGVSPQTVSRVVNNQPMVHRDTRRAVLAAVGELRYRPNRAARALATRRSQMLGVVLPQVDHLEHHAWLLGIDLAAQQYGYAVIIRHISTDAPALTRGQLNLLVDLGVEGLIVAAAEEGLVEAIGQLAIPIPVTYLDSALEPGVDDPSWYERASSMAIEHLVSLGHEHIIHVPGQASVEADAATQGYQTAMVAAGLEPKSTPPCVRTAETVCNIGTALAARREVTAVLVSGDLAAVKVLPALATAGIRVPEDISVVGLDDTAGAAHTTPPLTTVSYDPVSSGHNAVTALLRQVDRPSGPTRPVVQVVARQSTTAVRLPSPSPPGLTPLHTAAIEENP